MKIYLIKSVKRQSLEKCFVIESGNISLNRDVIRIGICQKYGPTKISLFYEYILHGERADRIKSRFIVKIDDDMIRQQIVRNWPSSLFGGSSARDTIQRPKDTVIVPNVPLEFQEEDILADINIDYRAICVKRLKNKEGQSLRAVVVQFQSEAERDQAMASGKLKFPSMYNIVLPMKLPTSRRKQREDSITNHV